MDFYQYILAAAIALAASIYTVLKIRKDNRFSKITLVIAFIISFVIIFAVWIGLSYITKVVFPA